MSFGGDGVVDIERYIEVSNPAYTEFGFIPRRFAVGGRLSIQDSPAIKQTTLDTCVLCGGVIVGESWNLEHPLPQWLHKYAGGIGDYPAESFSTNVEIMPNWRQLCLKSHQECNSTFARKIENPVVLSVKSMVEGGSLTWSQIDLVFDWLDKVMSSSAHMATGLLGHRERLGYHEASFPNRRVGLFDRLAVIFKVEAASPALDLYDCLDSGFLSTPCAIVLKIKDLIIIYASNSCLLSDAFGLGTPINNNNKIDFRVGSGVFKPGFGYRECRIQGAKIISQPMRRMQFNEGFHEESRALQKNGDGRIFSLENHRWNRVGSFDFSGLATVNGDSSLLIALEVVEWLICAKVQDFERRGKRGGYFMKSLPSLLQVRDFLIEKLV